MRNIELLAPAGNFECLKAAVYNGANAVYLGGKNFSARAFANNFDEEELKKAVRFAHLHDVRIFVTLNTLLTEKEFANAIKMADFYYENKVDALLIQDLGLYYYLKKKYPDFELHCSTQMHVHNLQGVRNARKLGFSRVVLARESTLDLIKEACKEDIEIETFVHGAICVSYSGQCLMSSSTKNRSANKGMCAQCCRLRYELYDEDDKKVKTSTDYLLSPKDMFLLNDIPDLIDAGVSSFKIEGRMKSAAYVGYVTRMYRKAIDAHLNNQKFTVTPKQMEELKVLFNRNFTNDLLRDKNTLFGQKTPNHLGIEIGETVNYRNGLIYIHLNKDVSQFDGIRINDFGCILNRLYLDGKLVNGAKAGQIIAIESDSFQKGKVYKTQDHLLEEEILKKEEKKVALAMDVRVIPEERVVVNLKHKDCSFTYESDIVALSAKNAPLDEASIIKQFSKLNDTVYDLKEIKVITDNAFLPLKQLNEVRRQAIEAFDDYRFNSFSRKAIYPAVETNHKTDLLEHRLMRQQSDQIVLEDGTYDINYVINTDSSYTQNKNAVVCEFGGLLKDYDHKIAYYTLNTSNSYAYEFLKNLGFDHIILSSELKEEQIIDLINAYKERNNEEIRPFVFTSGDRVLMYLKSDPFKDYIHDDKTYYLKENKNVYRIQRHGRITELIEENVSLNPENPSYSSFQVKLF